jgi:hypothetical protein
VIINPGGLAHTSIVLHDAILGAERPTVEVHISNIREREPFRRVSVVERPSTARSWGVAGVATLKPSTGCWTREQTGTRPMSTIAPAPVRSGRRGRITVSSDTLTPVAAALRLRDRLAFILRSVEGGARYGRYSHVGVAGC